MKDALDFETKESYSVTVNVHDGRDGAGASDPRTIDNSQDVTITVENVDEPGTVTLTTLTGVIQARVEVTAELSDDDGSVTGSVTWQWSQSPNGRTDWANISGATGEHATHPRMSFEGRYHPCHGLLHGRARGEQDRAWRIASRRKGAAGQLAARVPVHGGRAAGGGGELRQRHDRLAHPSPPRT